MLIDTLDMQSFNSLWFWLFLLLQWGILLFRPMGIPIDWVEEVDLHKLVDIHKTRWMAPVPWPFVVLGTALLTCLTLLGVIYGIELAQAGLIIILPWAGVVYITRQAARHMPPNAPAPHLRRLQARSQWIALATVCVATIVGIFHNLPIVVG